MAISFYRARLADRGAAAEHDSRSDVRFGAAISPVDRAQIGAVLLSLPPRDGDIIRALALVDRRLLECLAEPGLVLEDAQERDHRAVVHEKALLGAVRARPARFAHLARHLPEALVARQIGRASCRGR